MFKYISLTFILLFIISCSIPKRVIEDMTYCFDDKNIGIDSIINTQGFYYAINKTTQNKINPLATELASFIFYTNGFVTTKHPSGWLDNSLDDKYGFFGLAKLTNDTIKAQILTSPRGMSMGKYEVWFKVIDRNTIEMIYKGNDNIITQNNIEKFKSNSFYQQHGTNYIFFPLDVLPNFNNTYIINKKWFWCNEAEHKEWKKHNLSRNISE